MLHPSLRFNSQGRLIPEQSKLISAFHCCAIQQGQPLCHDHHKCEIHRAVVSVDQIKHCSGIRLIAVHPSLGGGYGFSMLGTLWTKLRPCRPAAIWLALMSKFFEIFKVHAAPVGLYFAQLSNERHCALMAVTTAFVRSPGAWAQALGPTNG